MSSRLFAAWLMALSGLGCTGGVATTMDLENVGSRDVPPSGRDDPGPGREAPPSSRDVPPSSPGVVVLGMMPSNQGGGADAATPGRTLDGGGSQ